MKLSKVLVGALVTLLLAGSALAANKGSLSVGNNVTVSGKALPAGEYTVKWEGSGPNVELNILRGDKVMATVPARVVELDRKTSNNTTLTKSREDGSKSLAEIRFAGKKYALAIGDESAKVDTANSTR